MTCNCALSDLLLMVIAALNAECQSSYGPSVHTIYILDLESTLA